MNDKKRTAYRTGVLVFLVLIVLTAAEFYLASVSATVAGLFVIALVKAALIIRYFMHVDRLWAEDSHE